MESNRAGMLVMDATTSEPAMSQQLASVMAEAGHGFLDTPVSGGPTGANSGSLAIMVGGAEADFERARPVLEAMSAKLIHIGPSGAGNVVKLVNNLMTASHVVISAEAALLAKRPGSIQRSYLTWSMPARVVRSSVKLSFRHMCSPGHLISASVRR
jgi:3-hydroxyisobutyrate dehydrogenase